MGMRYPNIRNTYTTILTLASEGHRLAVGSVSCWRIFRRSPEQRGQNQQPRCRWSLVLRGAVVLWRFGCRVVGLP